MIWLHYSLNALPVSPLYQSSGNSWLVVKWKHRGTVWISNVWTQLKLKAKQQDNKGKCSNPLPSLAPMLSPSLKLMQESSKVRERERLVRWGEWAGNRESNERFKERRRERHLHAGFNVGTLAFSDSLSTMCSPHYKSSSVCTAAGSTDREVVADSKHTTRLLIVSHWISFLTRRLLCQNHIE